MEINRVGVDLAKNVFQLHGADRRGKAVWKRRLSRGKWLAVLCDTVDAQIHSTRGSKVLSFK
jgi:transposase